MKVRLLHATPSEILIRAIRVCHDSLDKSDSRYITDNLFEFGEKDKKLIRGIIGLGHTSTLEHIYFNFRIEGISRLCLQELVRHRISSFSVKSTRYTLGKDFKKNEICLLYRSSGNRLVDELIEEFLERIFKLKREHNIKNDVIKYALPEAFKTELVWSINARSLRNFLALRMDKKAHFEIRELAMKIYQRVAEDGYGILFEDI